MRIYLSGPMGGMPQLNFPLFNKVEAALISQGHEVYNPATTAVEKGWATPEGEATGKFDIDAARKLEEETIQTVDLVLFLQGFENSAGAQREYAAALYYHKAILFVETLIA